MQKEIVVKSRSLGGSTDLTLLAPIKPGFVESLEAVTFKTRTKRTLELLHTARMMSHEYSMGRLLSDAVERVGVIQSVRVAVLEPENKVLLVVTFDGNWEAYIRVLWQKVGSLLDLVFCGTIDYVSAADHGFEDWKEWATRVQVETGFFYGPPDTSARDLIYLRRLESMRLRQAPDELTEIRSVSPTAEQGVKAFVKGDLKGSDDLVDPPLGPVSRARMIQERLQTGLTALSAVYRLADLYVPGTKDGAHLHKAARELLLEFVSFANGVGKEEVEHVNVQSRFARQLKWLLTEAVALASRRVPPRPEDEPALDAVTRDDVQGGILRAYENITHGWLLMVRFQDSQAAECFLADITTRLTLDSDSHIATENNFFWNIAFTAQGLRACGLDEDNLELFPEEFRQGMASRAGTLGDVRNNHPRRWRLPLGWNENENRQGEGFVDLNTVHAVLQIRTLNHPKADLTKKNAPHKTHPLLWVFNWMKKAHAGVQLLAAQDMLRHYKKLPTAVCGNERRVIVEHFGYADGNGQPEVEATSDPAINNRVHPGEVILGHNTAADFAVDINNPAVSEKSKRQAEWMNNGSFLVVRKYRQFVESLEAVAAEAAQTLPDSVGDQTAKQELIYAKMMGRFRNGMPFEKPYTDNLNNFDYADDENGAKCPLHAHVRRAHPRQSAPEDEFAGGRIPRLMRRSMSYGEPYVAAKKSNDLVDEERGLVFMAYNASIGEQFEVVQRWLAGGNSTGSFSGQSCPILGVPENGHPRHYRFEHDAKVYRPALEPEVDRFQEPETFTRLEWGMYLFAPSVAAMKRLGKAASSAAAGKRSVPWRVGVGRKLIAQLQKNELQLGLHDSLLAWKAALEDSESIRRLDSAAIWAAIREDHGGVLRTPYGVLVASRELVHQVLLDPDHAFSVCGQQERLKACYGDIYLGMDAGQKYSEQSAPVNQAIGALDPKTVFEMARDAAAEKLASIVKIAKENPTYGEVRGKGIRYSANFEVREVMEAVLATVCECWFGINETGGYFKKSGSDWDWKEGKPPLYPGHFTALSRYMFQPHPGEKVKILGVEYGQALRKAMLAFLADAHSGPPKDAAGEVIAPLAKAIMGHAVCKNDPEFVANTMIGVLMGLIPTLTGAIYGVLEEWIQDGQFWTLRSGLAGKTGLKDVLRILAKPMADASRMKPMPSVTWRTASKAQRIGLPGRSLVDVVPGDVVVLGLVSGTQESLADGLPDGHLMFGGVRTKEAGYPTHACPGYDAGMMVMLGTLTALLGCQDQLKAGIGSLSFALEGDVQEVEAEAESYFKIGPRESLEALSLQKYVPRPAELPDRQGQLILAWGDSWLDTEKNGVQFAERDIRDWLEAFGYEMPDKFCSVEDFRYTRLMAAVDKTAGFHKDLNNRLKRGQKPKAILLSGGGNDSVKSYLEPLLLPYNDIVPNSKKWLHAQALEDHIEGISFNYEAVLKNIYSVAGSSILVLVHAYDYPEPHGRGEYLFVKYGEEWMRKPFENKGYGKNSNYDFANAFAAMKALIDRLNKMHEDLVSLKDSQGNLKYPFLRYVNLRGTLATKWPNPADFEKRWFDDMHATDEGFFLIAKKIDEAIQRG